MCKNCIIKECWGPTEKQMKAWYKRERIIRRLSWVTMVLAITFSLATLTGAVASAAMIILEPASPAVLGMVGFIIATIAGCMLAWADWKTIRGVRFRVVKLPRVNAKLPELNSEDIADVQRLDAIGAEFYFNEVEPTCTHGLSKENCPDEDK